MDETLKRIAGVLTTKQKMAALTEVIRDILNDGRNEPVFFVLTAYDEDRSEMHCVSNGSAEDILSLLRESLRFAEKVCSKWVEESPSVQ